MVAVLIFMIFTNEIHAFFSHEFYYYTWASFIPSKILRYVIDLFLGNQISETFFGVKNHQNFIISEQSF